MAKKEKTKVDMLNYDADGNVIPAFPVNSRTKRDAKKSSVGFSVIAVILQILAIVPVVICPIFLALEGYETAPYYGFWHFIGVILGGVLVLAFSVIALIVQRRKSKHSIRSQMVKVLITFVCVTTVLGGLLTYLLPDVIAMATQRTIFVENLYYNGDKQMQTNLALERDFIRYNILNGTLADHKYAYSDMEAHDEEDGTIIRYHNDFINQKWMEYKAYSINALDELIEQMKDDQNKYDLYKFIYESYILVDFDYAFKYTVNTGIADTRERKALAVAMVDYMYEGGEYEEYLLEGFKAGGEVRTLFDLNWDSLNLDGYLTFDDPLLLFAQAGPRMTVPVIIRLLLDDTWTYSQPGFDASGAKYYEENGNFLFEIYDSEAKALYEEQVKDKPEAEKYPYAGKLFNGEEANYGYYNNVANANDHRNGWMIFDNGMVKRPVKWCVLDMDGKAMAVTKLDISNLKIGDIDIGGLLTTALDSFPEIVDALGGLLTDDLSEILRYATNGAVLRIGICLNDSGQLEINILPNNTIYGVLGFMNQSWVQSNNLLMAVFNLGPFRNWLYIFGATGSILIVASGVMRECGKKTRDRGEVAKDRLLRAKASKKHEAKNATEEQLLIEEAPKQEAPATT